MAKAGMRLDPKATEPREHKINDLENDLRPVPELQGKKTVDKAKPVQK